MDTSTVRFPDPTGPIADMRKTGVWLPLRDSEGGLWWPVAGFPGQYVKSENTPIGISWVALDLELTEVYETTVGMLSEEDIAAFFPWAEPNACRYCDRAEREHGDRGGDGLHVTGDGQYVAPSDELRLRRMQARRADTTTGK